MVHHLLAILVLHFSDSFVGSPVGPPSRSSLLHPFSSTFGSGFDPSPCTIIVLYLDSSSFVSAGISSFLLFGNVFLPVPQVAISFHIMCSFTLYLKSSQVYLRVPSFTLHCQSLCQGR